MGHSARSKFKREIRQQRLASLTGADKEVRRMAAIQGALEKAATTQKVSEPVTRARRATTACSNNTDKSLGGQTDDALADIIQSEHSLQASVRWGIAPLLNVASKPGNTSRNLDSGKLGKKLGNKGKAAAMFDTSSKKQKKARQKLKMMKNRLLG